jgi:hypothetical protein
MSFHPVLSLPLALAWLVAPAWLAAQDPDPRGAQIHAFGSVGYGRSQVHHYGTGSPGGDYGHAALSLNVAAEPAERLHVSGQIEVEQSHDEQELELDFAFAAWRFSDALVLRVGQVKQPFGLYAETHDVGTLRPFFLLPQGVYGATGFVAESFRGAGVAGERRLAGWALAYDAYAGAITLMLDEDGREVLAAGADIPLFAESGVTVTARDMLGARLVVHPPVAGLSFGLSAYSGSVPVPVARFEDGPPAPRPGSRRHSVGGASAEYVSARWAVRAEYAMQRRSGESSARAGYVEAARRLGRTQLALRYDAARSSYEALPAAGDASVLRHEDVGIGLSQWLSPNLVVRTSYHFVAGNRLAHPDSPFDTITELTAGRLKTRDRLWLVGAQFGF